VGSSDAELNLPEDSGFASVALAHHIANVTGLSHADAKRYDRIIVSEAISAGHARLKVDHVEVSPHPGELIRIAFLCGMVCGFPAIDLAKRIWPSHFWV
jgi:hypothetical protein